MIRPIWRVGGFGVKELFLSVLPLLAFCLGPRLSCRRRRRSLRFRKKARRMVRLAKKGNGGWGAECVGFGERLHFQSPLGNQTEREKERI